MAEFVNQRLEEMINELEQMKRIELYTAEEIKELSRKRKEFEYKIHRQIRCKEDYMRYVAFECLLLRNTKLRRNKMGISEKKDEIEYTISKRVSKLYKEMIARFPNDLDVWLNYMKFCKTVNFVSTITGYLEKLVQLHGDKAKVWQLAARWEYEEMNSLSNSRNLLLKGLHRHPQDVELYVDLLRIELLIVQAAIVKDQENNSTHRVEIIIDDSLEKIKGVSFVIRLLSTLDDFEFASALRDKLFKILWETHSDRTETWSYIAKCELQKKDVSVFDWKSGYVGTLDLDLDSEVLNFVKVFEAAHHKGIEKVYLSFANSVIEWMSAECEDRSPQLQVLNLSLTRGHEFGQLEEMHYKIWLQLFAHDVSMDKNKISDILKEACVRLPSSQFIWLERMKNADRETEDIFNIFKSAMKSIPKDETGALWTVVIERVQNVQQLESVRSETAKYGNRVSSEVKPCMLKRADRLGGADLARSLYSSVWSVPPFSGELHDVMARIELSRPEPDVDRARKCYEVACRQFGADDASVWLKWVKFELEHGRPERCGLVHASACTNLSASAIGGFLSEYSAVISGSET